MAHKTWYTKPRHKRDAVLIRSSPAPVGRQSPPAGRHRLGRTRIQQQPARPPLRPARGRTRRGIRSGVAVSSLAAAHGQAGALGAWRAHGCAAPSRQLRSSRMLGSRLRCDLSPAFCEGRLTRGLMKLTAGAYAAVQSVHCWHARSQRRVITPGPPHPLPPPPCPPGCDAYGSPSFDNVK